MKEYLNVDSEYVVYGIRTSNEANYYIIFDEGHLVEVPSSMFEIVDGKASHLWTVRNDDTNGVTLWPELFYDEDFFENFSDWEEKERKDFEELRKIFEESR